MIKEDFVKCPECKRRQLERLRQLVQAAELGELIYKGDPK